MGDAVSRVQIAHRHADDDVASAREVSGAPRTAGADADGAGLPRLCKGGRQGTPRGLAGAQLQVATISLDDACPRTALAWITERVGADAELIGPVVVEVRVAVAGWIRAVRVRD